MYTEDWLKEYNAKQQRAKSKGIKSAPSDTKEVFTLEGVSKKLKKRRDTVGATGNPHAKALARLAKKPELLKGNKEHWEQVKIFNHYYLTSQSTYELMSAVPNGGLRSITTARAIKAEGGKRGYPDVILDSPKGVYHGMRLELKVSKGILSESQIKMLNRLHDNGYYAVVVFGKDEAIKAIDSYLALAKGKQMPISEHDHLWLIAS